jgi:hypothetical protein
MEEKGGKAPRGISKIPHGGFTSEVSGRSSSWLTPDSSPFGKSYEGMNGQKDK